MGRDWSTIDSMLQGIDRYVTNRELNTNLRIEMKRM